MYLFFFLLLVTCILQKTVKLVQMATASVTKTHQWCRPTVEEDYSFLDKSNRKRCFVQCEKYSQINSHLGNNSA